MKTNRVTVLNIGLVLLFAIISGSITSAEPVDNSQANNHSKLDFQSTTGPRPSAEVSQGLTLAHPESSNVLNVPAYIWYRGCGPTAAGMVLGYWDNNGFDDLVSGSAVIQTAAVDAMISSSGNWNDYCLPLDRYPPLLPDKSEPPVGDEHADNSVADFMNTSQSAHSNYYGWSWLSHVDDALSGYVQYAAPNYSSIVQNHYFASFSWEDFKSEIDAGRPLVFLVDTNANGTTDHFVTAVGYSDDGGTRMYACLNTWDDNVDWYEYAAMAPGQGWGVLGITTFEIFIDTPDPDFSSSTARFDPTLPDPGQVMTVTTNLWNEGAPASNVVVTATIPNDTTYIDGSAATSQGSVSSLDPLVFDVGSVEYSVPITLTYAVTVSNSIVTPTVLYGGITIGWDGGQLHLAPIGIVNAESSYLPLVTRW